MSSIGKEKYENQLSHLTWIQMITQMIELEVYEWRKEKIKILSQYDDMTTCRKKIISPQQWQWTLNFTNFKKGTLPLQSLVLLQHDFLKPSNRSAIAK